MIRMITQEKIRLKLEYFLDSQFGTSGRESLILVEVTTLDSYDRWHIRRALHLPPAQIRARARSLLPSIGSEIALCGESQRDATALFAARALASLGYANLFVYRGGKEEWRRIGLPVESSLVPADGFGVEQVSEIQAIPKPISSRRAA